MWTLIIAFAWTGGVAWLLCRAGCGSSASIRPSNRAPVDCNDMPDLAVIVPARNEAAHIERCLPGLLAQDYPNGRLRIIVVDDNSADATASLVEQIGAA